MTNKPPDNPPQKPKAPPPPPAPPAPKFPKPEPTYTEYKGGKDTKR